MDSEHIIELFAAFGRVSVRRLFGGFGVYADGTMFALVSGGVIYLKADDETAVAFRREGQGPFTYGAKGGERVVMSYWRLPDRLYDDPDELAAWASVALAVARRPKRPKAQVSKARVSKVRVSKAPVSKATLSKARASKAPVSKASASKAVRNAKRKR